MGTLLPGWLNLDSLSVVRLAAVLLSLISALYLISRHSRSLSRLFLAGVFAGAFLFNAASFFELAGPYYWQPRNLRTVVILLCGDIGPSVAMVFLILFAYHFPCIRNSERREYRIVIAASIGLNCAVLGLNIYDHFVLQWFHSDTSLWDTYWLAFYISLGMQFAWSIIVLCRKTVLLSRHRGRSVPDRILHARGRDARASRALSIILLLPVVSIAVSAAVTYRLISYSLANYLTWLGILLFFLAFVVVYLNHSADPLTLQAKLLGATLVLLLGTMGLVSLVVGEASGRDYSKPPLPAERTTIRFSPNGRGGYDIASHEYAFQRDLGRRIDLSYGSGYSAELNFNFPFFGRYYRTVKILNGPLILLGARPLENGWGGYNPPPAIAPLIMNLDPRAGGGIYLRALDNEAVITWYQLPELGARNSNTIQCVLYKAGDIDFSFAEISPAYAPSVEHLSNYTAASTTGGDPSPNGKPAPFPPRLSGIHPGGSNARLVPIHLGSDLPLHGEGAAAYFDSYEADYADYLNQRIAPLAELTLAATILFLVLIPLLLRSSLFLPIRALQRGMHRAETGDLDVKLKPESRDEIGSLTRSFNRMVDSIARAETSFRALAEDAHDGIIVFHADAAVYANRRALSMFGVDSLAPDTRPGNLFQSVSLPPYGVTPDSPSESVLTSSKGPGIPVELVFSPTLWHGLPAVAVLLRDITRRKREEETAHQHQQYLMRMDKLSSLGVLAAGLAHDIAVPNEVILANATFLERASGELSLVLREAASGNEGYLLAGLPFADYAGRHQEATSAISKSSGLIDGVIQNLRDFSRDSPGNQTSPCDINRAIHSAVELVSAYIRRATDRFSMELSETLPRMRGTETRLEQVFVNLILNACHAVRSRDT
ncbi:sensor histidine kinase, partial [Salinispira pacifica]